MTPTFRNISTVTVKRRAKALVRETGIAHHEALDTVVQAAGFANWRHYLNAKPDQSNIPASRSNIVHSIEAYPGLVTTGEEAWGLLLRARQRLPSLTRPGLEDPKGYDSRGENLETCLHEIALCADWIRQLRPTKSINWRHTSYDYKHRVEAWGQRRVRAGESVPEGIANGSFIAAAVGLGFELERANLVLHCDASTPFGVSGRYERDRRSPNACFNFSEISLRSVGRPQAPRKRRSVYIKGIKPLHFAKRSAETFNVGDEAWISFDGHRALPVVVTDTNDATHYSVRYDGRSRGGEYGLFRDEVRGTPELACLNCVTS